MKSNIAPSKMERMILLDRQWRFALDNEDERKQASSKHQWKFRNCKAGREDGFKSSGYDDSRWELVDLPFDYGVRTAFSEENVHMRGSKEEVNVWFRKNFLMDESLSQRHFTLVFEGISMKAEIFFNGSRMADVPGAYTWTEIDVTPRMHYGKAPNYITVSVRGDAPQIWKYEGIGIYDHVRLLVRDPLHIAYNGLWAHSEKLPSGEWRLWCEAELENRFYEERKGKLLFELLDKEGKCVGRREEEFTLEGDDRKNIRTFIPLKEPRLWDVEDPYLYKVNCSVLYEDRIVDQDSVNAGFRTAEFDPEKGFLLNGRKVLIKGFCCHFEHAGVGFAVPESIEEYRVGLIKSSGANAYRCNHNECPESVLDACDRLGVLVMDENRSFETRKENLEMLCKQVRRSRKHPSVILYALFNEEPLQCTPEGGKIYRKIKSAVSKVDNTRAFTGCTQRLDVCCKTEAVLQPMDVVGSNYGIAMDMIREAFPEKPTLITEAFCMQTMRGELRYDPGKKLFDDYAVKNYWFGGDPCNTWKEILRQPYLSGLFSHAAFDYRGEPQPFDYPLISCSYGAMDTCGFPKTLYYVFQSWFMEKPMMFIFPHWNHKEGEKIQVRTVTNCEQTELFLNGKSLGVRECSSCEPCLWEVVFQPGTLTAAGYRGGKKVAEYTVKTAGAPQRLLLEPHRKVIANNGCDAVAVNVSAVDREGNLCPDADLLVSFRVSGGKVLGVGNGNPHSHEPDFATERKLFHGRCQAIVACTPGTEKCLIEAEAPGVTGCAVPLEVNSCPAEFLLPGSDTRLIDNWKISCDASPVKPDPNIKIDWSENNAFLALNMSSERFQLLQPGWMLYRTEIELSNSAEKNVHAVFRLGRARGKECEIWVNGKLLFSRKTEQDETFGVTEVEFDTQGASSLLLTVLLETSGGVAGINGRDAEIGIQLN